MNFIYKFSFITPKVEKSHVNRVLHGIFSLFPNYDFQTNLILVASRAGGNPVLLCQSKLSVITVMESWDHPVKIPSGFKSKIVYCWNSSLRNDWIEYQGDEDVQTFYPLKLRYWIENKGSTVIGNKKMVALYAAGTSSNTQSWLFNKEMLVIDTLCRGIQNTDLTLLIKPKPNGVQGDFDVFKERYPKVIVGEYSSVANSTSYYLSDAINEKRKSELDLCDFVINTFTTFCIDAALYGKPVMQLDFLEADDFDEIAKAQKNHHIKNYLLNRPDLTIKVADTDNLISQVSKIDVNDYSTFKEFSRSIVDWIAPHSLSIALEKLIFDVENLKKLANEK